MDNVFNFCIPLKKDALGQDTLIGVASTVSVDRDDEKMSENALNDMVKEIKSKGVNLFGNHEHNWENTLGRVSDADMTSNNQVIIKTTLDDQQTNPKVAMLLRKLERGIKLGLSVGGTVTKLKWEYSKELGKKIKVIDGVKLYEISVVGIPSNADSFLSIPQAISKSAKSLNIRKCPNCYHELNFGECDLCLYKQ
jgi:HK97 family phage prohead protease